MTCAESPKLNRLERCDRGADHQRCKYAPIQVRVIESGRTNGDRHIKDRRRKYERSALKPDHQRGQRRTSLLGLKTYKLVGAPGGQWLANLSKR